MKSNKKTIVLIALLLIVLSVILYLIWPIFKASPEWVSAIGTGVSATFSIASVIAVFLVWQQLQQNQRQLELNTAELEQTKKIAQMQFEDGLVKEYRELANRIPTKALLGLGLAPAQYAASFDELFRYIDLCNDQISLRARERISAEVWNSWCDGIQTNLSLPVFSRAWSEIKSKTSSFAELRRLEQDFTVDPVSWKKC
jgi:hypothetical protein